MQPAPVTIIPPRGPRLTLFALGYGALLLGWLSVEDQGVSTVTLLGAGSAVLIVLLTVRNHLGGARLTRRHFHWLLIGAGGAAGTLTGPATALLMLLKTALHAHLAPDYPLAIIGATLARTPAWGAAGLLIGIGVALLWWTRHQPRHTSNPVNPDRHL